ncbi:Protein of unknown function (DUF3659) [Teratosphaeria destructans]|uniref:DUF6987 domain-containing protein n=1 Tax=Teratosphaeria destructans TaxID=418781 RepID=A0A9W7VYJ8_9PEZI|nr:Protein of unknown function (DUF3659) [Teratosphaeria destructans]
MTSNSNQYAYYSFPPTPTRNSPALTRSSRAQTPQGPRASDTMAPSPAAGKQTGGAPKTPTKLGRKPGQTPQKLGQSAQESAKGTPSTPKAAGAKKPETDTSSVPSKPEVGDVKGKAQQTAQGAKDQAQGVAGDAKGKAEETAEQAKGEAEGGDDDEDDGPMSKVSQAGGEAKEGLEEAAPEPIGDDEDDEDDTVGGAAQQAQDTAEDAGEEAEDVADDATEKAGQQGEETGEDDETEDSEQQQGKDGGLLSGAKGLAGKASGLAGKASKDPAGAAKEGADDAKKGAEETAEGARETAEEGADEAQKVAGEATDEAGDAAERAEDTAEEGVNGVKDQAEEGVNRAKEQAEEGVNGAKDQAEDAADEAQTQAGTVEAPEGLPIDLDVVKGLEVNEDGFVYDHEGNAIGKLAEGDAEDLGGYPIGDDGEILDDDGDLVGRVELLPDEIKRQLAAAKERGDDLPEGADEYMDQLGGEEDEEGEEGEEAGPSLPGLEILNGLTCQIDGLIYDSDGNTIGRVVDGDPEELQNATLNENGEFIDEEGNVVGHAEIHEDAADLVEQGVYEAQDAGEEAAEGAQDQVNGVVGEAGDQADGAADAAEGAAEEAGEEAGEQVDGIEDQLPGIEALEGKELNEAGDIVDDQGDVLGHIEDEELKQKIADGELDPNTLKINEEGEVVDEDGNVLGKTELAEGAAEKLAGGPLLDLRILEGRKINKKGRILDEDGEVIGELRDGELKDCQGKKCNDKGEVLDKEGKVVGHVNVVPGEAAENATKELLEELGENEVEEQPTPDLPGLDILEGLKVNKKGQILNEDGEPIGELVDGELSECAGKKVNEKGEVLDKEGNVIGHVRTLPQEGEEEERQGEEQQVEGQQEEEQKEEEQQEEEQQEDEEQPEEGEEEEEDAGDQLPPLSVLEGLTVNKSGKIVDSNGVIVGELVEGDAKKLSKAGITCDAEGQFWDNKGHVIGRAQTVPVEDPEEEAPFAGLEGLHVVQDGFVEDEEGNRVGYITEGDPKKLIGRAVDEDGDVLDKKGSVVGHAERWEPEEEEEAPEEEPVDMSFLQGKKLNKAGLVIGDNGIPVARLIEGKAKDLAGKELDDQGQIWNDKGKVIGRVELIPEEERESKPEGPFAGLEGLRVIEGGKIADEDGNVVGEIVEGNPKRIIGLAVDEDGDIVDRYGNVKGHAEPLPEEEEEVIDNSILDGKKLNKQGYVVDENGIPFGRLVQGDVKELAGRLCDENGDIHNDTGKVVGHCEVIPENERVHKGEGPFAGLEGLRVVKDGWVEDEDGNVVGQLVEGNAKRLIGLAVDEDGDIIDKYGNVKGHAEPYEEEEQEQVDLSALAGTEINKSGWAVDGNGKIVGKVVEGDVSTLIGKKVDGQGQVWDNAGNVVGRCELALGQDTFEEGPFGGFEGLQIQKDGTVTTQSGDIVGRIIEGDIKKLMGHTVDEDGDILDKNGNKIGKAERWEPEEKERRVNPMSGKRVNKEGEVRDENGDLMGKLTDGDLGHCVGQEIDDAGNVVDVDGNKIGEVTLIENIVEEEYEGPTEEELEEARKREEEREIAEKMANICTQTLERVQPICKQIKEHMEAADRTPKEELDEEDLVNKVKPLIEEGGRILQECNGSLRGLDPDGHIAAQAKGRAGTKEATPEEHRLAETLKELTTTVVTTIDDAKKKLNDMPHAKKKLNPLWSLMTQPLFQILAAVGLLLAGVLGLVGQLLNGLGLGGLVNGLLGGLGINKLLESFGLKDKDKGKKKTGSAVSSLPVCTQGLRRLASYGYQTGFLNASQDDKPYIISNVSRRITNTSSPLSEGYTISSQSVFKSREDHEFYDQHCPAHKVLKVGITGGWECSLMFERVLMLLAE